MFIQNKPAITHNWLINAYDCFCIVQNGRNQFLYLKVHQSDERCKYLIITEKGTYSFVKIDNNISFCDYVNDEDIIYLVNKDSIKFNEIAFNFL